MSNIIRIKLKAYDHRILDNAATKIVETIKRNGGVVSGPVPLPTEIDKITILRAVHKYKDSREQFEMRTHKRLIDVKNPNNFMFIPGYSKPIRDYEKNDYLIKLQSHSLIGPLYLRYKTVPSPFQEIEQKAEAERRQSEGTTAFGN